MLKTGDQLMSDSTGGDTWRVVRPLGRGTCCEAYKVQSTTNPETKAALKIYKDGDNYHHAHDAEALLLDLVSRANGPSKYLVKTIDDFDHQERPCLVQELLDLDLRQMLTLNQSQGLSLYIIKKFALNILRGVQQLHKSGFVHADLKPTNLLWSPQDSCVKVIDYSLSYHVQDKSVGRLQSQGYRAPEIELWNHKVARADTHMPSLVIIPNAAETDPQTSNSAEESSDKSPNCDEVRGSSSRGQSGLVSPRGGSTCNQDTSQLSNICDTNSLRMSSECHSSNQADNPMGPLPTLNAPCDADAPCDLPKPSRTSDMWSVGCVVAELFIGSKLFTKNKLDESQQLQMQGTPLTSVLRNIVDRTIQPRQPAEPTDQVEHLKQLIQGLLQVDEDLRFTVDQALKHSFFKIEFIPDFRDLCVLSSPVLRLLNVVEDLDLQCEDAYQDLLTDLLTECEKFGPITKCVIPRDGPGRGKVYMAYSHPEDSLAAYTGLTRREYNNRTVVLTYFPNDDFLQNTLY